ncbi:MAG: hypothetical protein ACR2F1_05360 [Nitrososphaeraceae archaeon]
MFIEYFYFFSNQFLFYFFPLTLRNFIIKELSSGIKPRQQAIQGVKTISNFISRQEDYKEKKLKDYDVSILCTHIQTNLQKRPVISKDIVIPDEKFIEIIITIIIEYSKSLKD